MLNNKIVPYLPWCEVRPGNPEKEVLDRYNWRMDAKCDWLDYQDAVVAEFAELDVHLAELKQSLEGEALVEVVWELWKKNVITAAEKGSVRRIFQRTPKDGGQRRLRQLSE